jgi:hypothetical protein
MRLITTRTARTTSRLLVFDRTCWSSLEALGGGKERRELEKRREGTGRQRRKQGGAGWRERKRREEKRRCWAALGSSGFDRPFPLVELLRPAWTTNRN